jgi:2,3-bisphosphoglycerate-independent phosphoglycerate mutase
MSGKILCIIDGMTDKQLNRPRALLPFAGGSFLTTPLGHETESLPCILTLLGISPKEIPHQGRGWVEAVGKGIPVTRGDLVLRTTWVKTDDQGRIVSLASPMLSEPIEGFTPLGDYKGILVFKGQQKLLKNIQTYAPHKAFGQSVRLCMPKGLPPITQPFSEQNIFLVPWGESSAVALPNVQTPSVVVCGIDLVRGIGRIMGFEIVDDAAFTGDTNTDIIKKTKIALAHAQEGKFVLLHFNGADEAAHRRNALEKSGFVEKIVVQCALPLLQSGVFTVVTSDHGTDSGSGCHIDSPQPFYTNGTNTDGGVFSGRLAMQLERGMACG